MNNNSYVELKQLTIHIVSPVAIGSGTVFTKKDYIYDFKKEEVVFLKSSAFHQYIYDKKLLKEYEAFCSSNPSTVRMSLADWTAKFMPELRRSLYAENDVVKSIEKVHRGLEKTNLNDIHEHIKTATGELYIPGSSIKGMIRSAILFSLIKKSSSNQREYANRLAVDLEKMERQRRVTKGSGSDSDNFSKSLFQRLDIRDDRGRTVSAKALLDVMRGISCSDAHLVEPIDACIVQKLDFSIIKAGKETLMPLFREAIPRGAQLSFTLSVDKRITEVLGIMSVEDVLERVEEYFNFTNNVAAQGFGKQFDSLLSTTNGANCYLGSGVGLLAKSSVYALDYDKAVKWMQTMLSLQFRKGGHNKHGNKISPHVLKGTYYQGKNYLMGLARISIDE